MINYEIQEEESKNTLRVNGELSISVASEFKDLLVSLHDTSKDLYFDFSDVSSIDTSCLQLICAAHKSCIQSNRNVVIGEGISESIKQSVFDSGFSSKCKCSVDTSRDCLWAHNDERDD